jgi:ribose transport system substrate-binding protein
MIHRRAVAAIIVAAAASMSLAGCGSSGPSSPAKSSTKTGTAASASGIATAKTLVSQMSVAPTAVTETTPLTGKPPHKTVGFVVCPTGCSLALPYLQSAVKAIGWTLKTANATESDPGAAFQSLMDEGVNYIFEIGFAINQFQSQAAALKASKIPLFEVDATDTPEGPANDVYSSAYGITTAQAYGSGLADWVIANSNGAANVVILDVPAIQILAEQANAGQAEIEKLCPSCKVTELPLSVTQLGSGAIPGVLTTYLQTHTSVNYVWNTFPGIDNTGVQKSLKAAGSTAKIVGTNAGQPQLQEVIAGTEAAWSVVGDNAVGPWQEVDQMARLATGQWSLADAKRSDAASLWYILSTPAQAQAIVKDPFWLGPAGYQSAYEKLWGV